jgi:hypothetical protein
MFRQILLYIILGSFLFFFIYAIVVSSRDIKIENKKVSFVIFNSRTYDLKNGIYTFFYLDKKYEIMDIYYNTWVFGDKFKLEYNFKKPDENKILFEEPVFLDSEPTVKTTGTISKIVTFGNDWIIFNYKVGNQIYERVQIIPEDYTKKHNIKLGDKFVVVFWLKNFQRAIIYLSSPK